jgi:hypothetical protein
MRSDFPRDDFEPDPFATILLAPFALGHAVARRICAYLRAWLKKN